jgi:hypothetical protein
MYVINNADENLLVRPFAKMGARVKFGAPETWRESAVPRPIALDVRSDGKGEYFFLRKLDEVSVEVLDVEPRDQHLVLLARVPHRLGHIVKSRFLLGHDERHWFVAAIPEATAVSTVTAAKEALKPEIVVEREAGVRTRVRTRRINKARVRQGEWFFVPARLRNFAPLLILGNEPLRRGRGKPHVCQELYRMGGETVYVNRRNPNGITAVEFAQLGKRRQKREGWRLMVRDPRVFVRGTVRHPDHKTIFLDGWHEVFMNTETRAAAMRNVAFLD